MQTIFPLVHLMRAAFISGLLTKEEIIELAENMVQKDEKPDIFFIDLLLLNNRSDKEILQYINSYI